MICTPQSYRTFLVCCNVALLFVGLSVLILGLKMKWAMSVLLLINIPIVLKTINSVIATGFFISLSGVSGICGACFESMWLLIGHLVSLGVIVIMEFSLGVTLMIVKKTIQDTIDSRTCNNMCAASLDAIILDYALPSAGLMMTIIFFEALMIYSSIRLYFHIRDRPKVAIVIDDSSIVQSVPMRNVPASQPVNPPGPELHYFALYQPQPNYVPVQFVTPVLDESKPPDYNSLVHHLPAYPRILSPRLPLDDATTVPKEIDETFNSV